METGQIEAFERVARLGSFTKAAEDLDLTQPSISARIAALEQELGGELFERGKRRLELTPLGEAFLPHAERALAAMLDGRQAVNRYLDGKLGQVFIASITVMSMTLLPEPFKRFRREYPSVDLVLAHRSPPQVLDMLHSGEVDFGITGTSIDTTGKSFASMGIRLEAHFQQVVRAVVSSKHPLAQLQAEQGKITLADVYNHSIYYVPLGPHTTTIIREIAEGARRGSGGAVVAMPAAMVVQFVIQDFGLSFLPENFIRHHVEAGRLVHLNIEDMPQLHDEPLIISLEGRQLSRPAETLIRMIRAQWRHILI